MIIHQIKKITKLPYLNLFSAQYSDRKNNTKQWVFVSRSQEQNPMENRTNQPDAVVIVPYHLERKALVLIKEFRVALGGFQYGFPAGLLDKGETIETAGERELHEETGLKITKVLKTSPAIFSSSGLTDESVSLLFVECNGEPSNEYNEASEDIEVLFFTKQEAVHVVNDPKIKFDVKTWIILNHFAGQEII